MLLIEHRVNTVEHLKSVPLGHGIEIDVRAHGQNLYLHHEPFKEGESLERFLDQFKHELIVFNVKEAGIEQRIIELATQYQVPDFFLLDVEFPYLYRATRSNGERRIAVRFSEAEGIDTVLLHKGLVDWVWIDCNTRLPLDGNSVEQLHGFKTCLVSPDRWGRPQDIIPYRRKMHQLGFQPDAVMSGSEYIIDWTKTYD